MFVAVLIVLYVVVLATWMDWDVSRAPWTGMFSTVTSNLVLTGIVAEWASRWWVFETHSWWPLQLVATRYVAGALFYYAHRVLHTRWLFKRVHKKHHEYTEPNAIEAFYAHPLEHVIIMFCELFPAYLCRLPMWVTVLWSLAVIANALAVHSGWWEFGRSHDLHHKYFTVNFGGWEWLDRLHGTFYE